MVWLFLISRFTGVEEYWSMKKKEKKLELEVTMPFSYFGIHVFWDARSISQKWHTQNFLYISVQILFSIYSFADIGAYPRTYEDIIYHFHCSKKQHNALVRPCKVCDIHFVHRLFFCESYFNFTSIPKFFIIF